MKYIKVLFITLIVCIFEIPIFCIAHTGIGYNNLFRLFNIQNEVISMSSDSYEEVDDIDIPKQLIIDTIKEKIEKDEQDLRNAKIEFTNIKLTTGFE